ncbi:MAG: adenosine deaminase [Spirochaetaceae bacterium]|nr:adenosine deaminase [Spirochaetaceae bacterium]
MSISEKFNIEALPKTEIHLHLEALASYESLAILNDKYKILPEFDRIKHFEEQFNFDNLGMMIDQFLFFQTFYRDVYDYQHLLNDLEKYMLDNSIYYIELYISPTMIKKQGYVDILEFYTFLNDRIRNMAARINGEIKIITDVSRSFGLENAMENLNDLYRYQQTDSNSQIIGIGLGGREKNNPASDYKTVFDRARELGLRTVAHAGEEVGSESVSEAIDILKVSRIGHGTSLILDDELMRKVSSMQIPVEVCPTSNIVTKYYVSELSEHPIKKFIKQGLNVSVNTDDPVLFHTDLNKEYIILFDECGLSETEVLQIVKNGLYSTFLSDSEKDFYWSTKVEPFLKSQWHKSLIK